MTTCIVCKQHTDKFDPAFGAGFCESEHCVSQMNYAWGSIELARVFYKSLWTNADGTPRTTPLNIIQGVKTTPDFYKFVEAGRYLK